jgi:hypothetical protein
MKIVAHVWQWKPATRWSIVLGLGVASVVVVASLPAIPQPLSYHSFADTRIFLGIPNALDVLSNLSFIVVGVLGLYFGLRPQSALTSTPRWAYGTMFAGLILTELGSGYYHSSPDNHRLVWDRLPMTLAMAGFMSAMLVDRLGPKMLWLLPAFVAVGTGSVLEWNWSEQAGHGDLRWYALYQGLVMVVGVLLMLLFPSRTLGTREFVIAAAGNVAAKVFELLDKPIYHLGGVVSGHSLKHLSAGLAFMPLALLLSARGRW